jgi:uncharacterized protein YyaL (SSP411 family)
MDTTNKPNRLQGESSPYLLQHAYNPVNWYPWGEEALSKARQEDKLILVSIGYSACHWCHVMERESFENEKIAEIMNKHYVCIKVDREERPDIDQIYMDAVQTMGLQGGWPLNVFLLPDTRPFYGGTYFPPDTWVNVLQNIAIGYVNHKEELTDSAEKFSHALNTSEIAKFGLKASDRNFTADTLNSAFAYLSRSFDRNKGGMKRAPKFPMPGMYTFLLRYYDLTGQQAALDHVKLTLRELAFGGIYDQISGGFARYSVDANWFAPHFEKMLYDNAQLITLYAEAYAATKDELYRQVILETAEFIRKELSSPEGGFYSALDADSEGVEGKFYTWKYEELADLLHDDIELFAAYYGVEEEGNWEEEVNILYKSMPDETFARLHGLDIKVLQSKVANWKTVLMSAREKRVRPGLDDKILASWNGLMLTGLADAYRVLNEESLLQAAQNSARFIRSKMQQGDRLMHSYKEGRATVTGFLEDYAAVIQGYTALYQASFDEEWIREAASLTQAAIDHFYDPAEEMFFFTANDAEKLIARKKEFFDNVIPSSNSIMARNLYELGMLLDKAEWVEMAGRMVSSVKKLLEKDVQYLYNFAILYTQMAAPTAEVAIVGEKLHEFRKELDAAYFPNKLLAGTLSDSNLPLLQNRDAENGKTTIYVCYNKACQLPVNTIEAAREQMMAARKG